MKMKPRFFYRKTKGSLKDSMKTIHYIDEHTFINLIKHCKYYCFDERVNQVLWFNPLYYVGIEFYGIKND